MMSGEGGFEDEVSEIRSLAKSERLRGEDRKRFK